MKNKKMKRKIIIIVSLLCFIFQLNAQSDKFDDAYYSINQLKEKYGKEYKDSIYVFGTNNYKKDLKLIKKLKNLEILFIFEDFKKCYGRNDVYSCKEKKIPKILYQIPSNIKYLGIEGNTPLPLPFDLLTNCQILEELHIDNTYFPEKTDSVILDLSKFIRLHNFSFNINLEMENQPIYCYVKMPPNLITYSGYFSDEMISYDYLPRTLEYLDIQFDSIYPRQLFGLTNLKSLIISNDQPLTEDFLSLKSLKSLTLENLTSQDVFILSQMSSVDTIVWNNKKPFFPRASFLDIAKGIPIDMSKLKVKCIIVSGFDQGGVDGFGWQYNLHIATIIKRRIPEVNVFYYVGYNKPMREVTETDLKQKNFYDCKSLDE